MTDKTLDEHAAEVERRNDVPLDRAYANILAAYEAERAARVVLGDSLRNEVTARLDAEERAQKAEARVRELEADQAQAAQAVVDAQACEMAFKERAERAEATLAETRAHLTGLWEAAGAVDEADASGDDTVLGVAIRHLRGVINADGPTLAELGQRVHVQLARLRETAENLPGILPPDAGRLERAARRYAIAVLSMYDVGHVWPLRHLGEVEIGQGIRSAVQAADDEVGTTRLLRARVALYLRWCERVERGDVWGWWDGWSRHKGGVEMPWHNRNELLARDVRWAQPLWTHAPAHDPAVTAAERRKRKEKR